MSAPETERKCGEVLRPLSQGMAWVPNFLYDGNTIAHLIGSHTHVVRSDTLYGSAHQADFTAEQVKSMTYRRLGRAQLTAALEGASLASKEIEAHNGFIAQETAANFGVIIAPEGSMPEALEEYLFFRLAGLQHAAGELSEKARAELILTGKDGVNGLMPDGYHVYGLFE